MISKLRVNSSLQDEMISAIERAKQKFKYEKNYVVVLGDDGFQYANAIDKVYKDGFLSGGVFYPFVAFREVDELNAKKIVGLSAAVFANP
jgi:hypothetical protein